MRVCITLLLALWASALSSASLFSDEWDDEFKDATEVFLPLGTDWRLLKAQCYQESLLDPFAVSHVGAAGLCQFMPGTWSDARMAIGASIDADRFIPEASIRAAGWYMGRLHGQWRAERPSMDRFMLSAASYNAGLGHLVAAQRLCGGENLYRDIIPCLSQVTGNHSKETVTYVQRIVGRWWPAMLFQ